MQQTEVQIVRKETIAVKSAAVDNYGKLIVLDTANKRYSLSDKREALFAMFQPGAVIELHYSNYMNKDYIADAIKIGTGPVSPPAPPAAAKPGTPTESVPVSGPEHGLALEMVGDLLIAGKLKEDDALVKKMWSELHRVLGTN